MNNENKDHQDDLLDALLHEHRRDDREQEIQTIISKMQTKPITALPKKSRPSWPWAAGIAATITFSSIYIYKSQSNKDIIAYQVSEERSQDAEKEKVFGYIDTTIEEPKKVSTSIDRKPSAPSNSTARVTASEATSGASIPVPTVRKEMALKESSLYFGDAEELRAGQSSERVLTELAARDDLGNQPTDKKNKGYGVDLDSSQRGAREVMNGFRANEHFARQADGIATMEELRRPSPTPSRPRIVEADKSSSGDRFGSLIDPSWKNPLEDALSTFSVDVDNASYSNIRRALLEGRTIHQDSVRIEELINAFDYGYATPGNEDAFAVHQSIATSPWNEKNALLRIGIKGREIKQEQRPASNLVFLIDVSGSMQSSDKLPLVKESLKLLIGQLDERDSVSYVVYAGTEGVVLPPTTLDKDGRAAAIAALNKLESGGSTNGGAGIKRAYEIAAQQYRKGGTNRVILCSDGDFNVGVTGTSNLVGIVKERAAANIYLTVLSFGTGNLNEEMLEAIARDGNGNHYYIDNLKEAHRVFLQKLSGTLITIAKDVKLQIEFNPAKVKSYRLIGYANRVLRNQDFSDDKVDAGDIGAGHEVTAFYEIIPADGTTETVADTDLKYQRAEKREVVPAPAITEHADEWLTLKLRHKHPEGDKSSLQEHALRGEIEKLGNTDTDFRFATAVAMFGMKLRQDSNIQSMTMEQIRNLASEALGDKPSEQRVEFIDMLNKMQRD